ncbi:MULTISPECIES: NAD(P)H-hydrate dehydratase [Hyphobacterium]|uniref:Bifunctional NAD(P)H-hydrate repair enzyme n=1 Tax=Hyphobacterium vulgare TaxID=1736751 RepID=A0ABV6ZX80_9PROT
MTPGPAEIFSVDGVRRADRHASGHGRSAWVLMQTAGRSVVDAITARWSPRQTVIFVGPGNNGGDGFVIANGLSDAGWPVRVVRVFPDRNWTGDAHVAAQHWAGPVNGLGPDSLSGAGLIVDAIFGTGLSRSPEGEAAELIAAINACGAPVVAVDIPSGLNGDRGEPQGEAVEADLTVTFHRLRPAHLLQPSRQFCGKIVCADIGIPDHDPPEGDVVARLNHPALWPDWPETGAADTHKHRKGRLAVLSGPAKSTGAARMAAVAGLRAGAGLVTMLTPPGAALVNANHLTEVMIRSFRDVEDFLTGLDAIRATAAVLGPAAGKSDALKQIVIAALSRPLPVVLDGDALSVFCDDPGHLLGHLRDHDVITPHAGEFERLFPGLSGTSLNKIEAARAAADRAGCVVVFKGADSVIAVPGRTPRINTNASPALATAGTGDTLAGLIGGLLAQGAPAFDAASAAVWLHGEAGLRLGSGLIAGELADVMPAIMQDLARRRRIAAVRAALIGG